MGRRGLWRVLAKDPALLTQGAPHALAVVCSEAREARVALGMHAHAVLERKVLHRHIAARDLDGIFKVQARRAAHRGRDGGRGIGRCQEAGIRAGSVSRRRQGAEIECQEAEVGMQLRIVSIGIGGNDAG